jgi:hypothetical protein
VTNVTYVQVMTCSTPDKTDGLVVLTDGCKAVEEKILGSGGNFVMQMAPKVRTAASSYLFFLLIQQFFFPFSSFSLHPSLQGRHCHR